MNLRTVSAIMDYRDVCDINMNINYTITGVIDANVAQQMISWVNQHLNSGAAITGLKVYISSTGGDVDSAIRIYFYLKGLPFKVETIGISQIDSAANIIFLAGEERSALQGCRFFLHNIVFNTVPQSGHLIYFQEIIKNFEEMEKRHVSILMTELSKTEKQIKDILKDAKFHSPIEAKKLGLVTSIIDKL